MTLSYDTTGTRIVLIGTSECPEDPDNLPKLPSVKNNVNALSAEFLSKEVIGLEKDCVEVILNPRSRTSLLLSLRSSARVATDTLIVYYAGHGMKSLHSDGLFIPTMETTQDDCHINGVEFKKIREIIYDSPAKKKILIFDCCYSGEIHDNEMGGSDESTIRTNIEINGVYSIASSPRNKISYAPKGAEFTAFSGELINVIRNGIEAQKEFITLEEAFQKIKTCIARNPKLPSPHRSISGDLGNFRFAKNAWFESDPEQRIKKYQKKCEELENQLKIAEKHIENLAAKLGNSTTNPKRSESESPANNSMPIEAEEESPIIILGRWLCIIFLCAILIFSAPQIFNASSPLPLILCFTSIIALYFVISRKKKFQSPSNP